MHAGRSESEDEGGELHYNATTCRWVFNAVTLARFDFLKCKVHNVHGVFPEHCNSSLTSSAELT